jgi:hypothetical protein
MYSERVGAGGVFSTGAPFAGGNFEGADQIKSLV